VSTVHRARDGRRSPVSAARPLVRNDDGRECALFRQQARGKTEVAAKILQPRRNPDVARAFNGEGAADKRSPCGNRGVASVHAACLELTLLQCAIEPDFLGQVRVEFTPAEPLSYAADQMAHSRLEMSRLIEPGRWWNGACVPIVSRWEVCQNHRRLVNDGNRGRRKSTGTEETEVT